MSEDESGLFGRLARRAGRTYERTRSAYREGRSEGDLPRDGKGRAKIVCRRFAERRAAPLDSEGRPACFDADHDACRGCVEDIRDGIIETWE
jgi:hypothetical protein